MASRLEDLFVSYKNIPSSRTYKKINNPFNNSEWNLALNNIQHITEAKENLEDRELELSDWVVPKLSLGERQIEDSTITNTPADSLVEALSRGLEGRYNRGNMRQEILELLELELGWRHDKEFHLGEARRKRGVTYGVKNSNHYDGNAVDLTPRGSMTYELMRLAMINNPRIRLFFKDNHIGILDETSAETRKKTNATGAHYHIGPDPAAVRGWNNWLKLIKTAKLGGILKAEYGTKINDVAKFFAVMKPFLASENLELIVPLKPLELQNFTPLLRQPFFTKSDITESLDLQDTDFKIPILKLNAAPPTQNDVRAKMTKTYGKSKGFDTFNKAFDEYLKIHPEDADTRSILTKIASNESSFVSNAQNPVSTACGYFGFTDGTRKDHSRVSKLLFISNPVEQIATAVSLYRYLEKHYVNPNIDKFAAMGLDKALAVYGYWFRPASMLNLLKYGKDNYRDPLGTSLYKVLSSINE